MRYHNLSMEWIDGLPLDEPPCGYYSEFCTQPIRAAIIYITAALIALAVILIVVFLLLLRSVFIAHLYAQIISQTMAL